MSSFKVTSSVGFEPSLCKEKCTCAMKYRGKAKVLAAQSRPSLCDPVDCNPPGSSVHGIFQARILEWVAISSLGGSCGPRDQTLSPALAGGFFTTEPLVQFSSVTQSCPILRPHESQHSRPPCPSPTPGVHSDPRPLSQ